MSTVSTDYGELRRRAQAGVAAELGGVDDPVAKRAAAEELRDQAYRELSALRPKRQRLIAAAALYESVPQLHERFGIQRRHMRRLALDALYGLEGRESWHYPPGWPADPVAAAREAGIEHPDNVVAEAERVAARYEFAEARRDAAVRHLEAAQEAVRLAGGRVRVQGLERPDFDAVRRQARAGVLEQFAKLVASPEEQLQRAVESVAHAGSVADALLDRRDAAVASVAFYTTARGVYLSAGISRTGMARVLRRALGLPRDAAVPPRAEQPAAARAAGVKFVKDAAETLPRAAAAYEAAQAQRKAAMEIRDEAVRVLHAAPYGRSLTELAEAIGRDRKIVSRLVDPTGTHT